MRLIFYAKKGEDAIKKIIGCVLSILIFLPLFSCDQFNNSADEYLIESEPPSLDTAIADDMCSELIIKNLFEGLCSIDDEGKAVPAVARSYSANKDFTCFNFYLRENAAWADGKTTVKAQDFVFAVRRVLDPANRSPFAKNLFCIKNAGKFNAGLVGSSDLGISAVNNRNLKVELAYSYENFPLLTATTPFMPCNEEFLESTEGMYGLEANAVLPNGPFKFRSDTAWEHNKSISLVHNPAYTGKIPQTSESLKFSIQGHIGLSSLYSGDTDALIVKPDEYSESGVKNYSRTYIEDTVWGIGFNCRDSVYKNKALKMALLSGINREKALSALPENCREADGLFPAETTLLGMNYRHSAGESDLLGTQPDANLTFSRASAGSNFRPATILCLDAFESKQLASSILADFNSISRAFFNLEPLPYDALIDRVKASDYQIAIFPLSGESGEVLPLLWKFSSGDKDNLLHFADSRFDSLLDTCLVEPSSCPDAENYLLQNGAFYPLYFESRCIAERKTGLTGAAPTGAAPVSPYEPRLLCTAILKQICGPALDSQT